MIIPNLLMAVAGIIFFGGVTLMLGVLTHWAQQEKYWLLTWFLFVLMLCFLAVSWWQFLWLGELASQWRGI